MSLGKRIRETRKKKKMTLKEVAERANISISYLSDIEHERCNPSVDTLYSLSNIFHVSIDYLFGLSDSSMPDYIKKRVLEICIYILETRASVEQVAEIFNISESTVYNDITKRLPTLSTKLTEMLKETWGTIDYQYKDAEKYALLAQTLSEGLTRVTESLKNNDINSKEAKRISGLVFDKFDNISQQSLTIREKEPDYSPKLEELVPREEVNLAEAMIKISEIAYTHNLTKEEATYLMHRAVDHYGKPEFPEETYEAAHGPQVPGQIDWNKEEEE